MKRCRWCKRKLNKRAKYLFCTRACMGRYEKYLGHWHWNWDGTNKDTRVWEVMGRPCRNWYFAQFYENEGFRKRKHWMSEELE